MYARLALTGSISIVVVSVAARLLSSEFDDPVYMAVVAALIAGIWFGIFLAWLAQLFGAESPETQVASPAEWDRENRLRVSTTPRPGTELMFDPARRKTPCSRNAPELPHDA